MLFKSDRTRSLYSQDERILSELIKYKFLVFK